MEYKDKETEKARRAKRYQENKEVEKLRAAKYYQENKNSRKAYLIEYRREHKEDIKAKHAEYLREHKSEISAKDAEQYQENKEQICANQAEYYRKNPDKSKARVAKRRAQKAGVPCDGSTLVDVIGRHGQNCLCCGTDQKLSVDHVIPISYGGHDTIENLQPLCLSCNDRKGTKIIDYRREKNNVD